MVSQHVGQPFALHHISRAFHRRVTPDRCLKVHARSLCAGEVLKCVRHSPCPNMATARAAERRVVHVLSLGRMGFLQAHDLQLRYARQHLQELAGRRNTVGRNTLLVVEHNPVYTVGLRAEHVDMTEQQRLKDLGAEFYRCNRGGLLAFHGPGQLVAYPVLNLRHFGASMKDYVSGLQSTLAITCHHLGLEARVSQTPGIWVGGKQVAAVGVHASRRVTTHGIAINCDTELSWFRHIRPCGARGQDVSSLSEMLQTPTPIHQVVGPFLDAFQQQFQCHMEFSLLDPQDTTLFRPKEEGREVEEQAEEGSLAGWGFKEAGQGLRRMSSSSSTSTSSSGDVYGVGSRSGSSEGGRPSKMSARW